MGETEGQIPKPKEKQNSDQNKKPSSDLSISDLNISSGKDLAEYNEITGSSADAVTVCMNGRYAYIVKKQEAVYKNKQVGKLLDDCAAEHEKLHMENFSKIAPNLCKNEVDGSAIEYKSWYVLAREEEKPYRASGECIANGMKKIKNLSEKYNKMLKKKKDFFLQKAEDCHNFLQQEKDDQSL